MKVVYVLFGFFFFYKVRMDNVNYRFVIYLMLNKFCVMNNNRNVILGFFIYV